MADFGLSLPTTYDSDNAGSGNIGSGRSNGSAHLKPKGTSCKQFHIQLWKICIIEQSFVIPPNMILYFICWDDWDWHPIAQLLKSLNYRLNICSNFIQQCHHLRLILMLFDVLKVVIWHQNFSKMTITIRVWMSSPSLWLSKRFVPIDTPFCFAMKFRYATRRVAGRVFNTFLKILHSSFVYCIKMVTQIRIMDI